MFTAPTVPLILYHIMPPDLTDVMFKPSSLGGADNDVIDVDISDDQMGTVFGPYVEDQIQRANQGYVPKYMYLQRDITDIDIIEYMTYLRNHYFQDIHPHVRMIISEWVEKPAPTPEAKYIHLIHHTHQMNPHHDVDIGMTQNRHIRHVSVKDIEDVGPDPLMIAQHMSHSLRRVDGIVVSDVPPTMLDHIRNIMPYLDRGTRMAHHTVGSIDDILRHAMM